MRCRSLLRIERGKVMFVASNFLVAIAKILDLGELVHVSS
jgi:hypothetical protein